MVLKFCRTKLIFNRKGQYLAQVEHGLELYKVYSDGTVLIKEHNKLYDPYRMGISRKVINHVRYNGRRVMRDHYGN
jgi:hypothetical protein